MTQPTDGEIGKMWVTDAGSMSLSYSLGQRTIRMVLRIGGASNSPAPSSGTALLHNPCPGHLLT
jgi:hypothetical protein